MFTVMKSKQVEKQINYTIWKGATNMKKRTLICIITAVCLLLAAGAAAVVLSRRPQTPPDTPPEDTEASAESFDIRNNVLYSYAGKNTEVRVPDGVTSIESGAFDSCDTLTDIYLPESLQSVAEGAFPTGPEEYRLHFSNNRLEGLTPEIRAKGMENCIVVIPGDMDIWYEDLPSLRYVKGFEVSGEQKYFAAKDGVLYNGDMSALYVYPAYKDAKEFVIPDETDYIYSKAFSRRRPLKICQTSGALPFRPHLPPSGEKISRTALLLKT